MVTGDEESEMQIVSARIRKEMNVLLKSVLNAYTELLL